MAPLARGTSKAFQKELKMAETVVNKTKMVQTSKASLAKETSKASLAKEISKVALAKETSKAALAKGTYKLAWSRELSRHTMYKA